MRPLQIVAVFGALTLVAMAVIINPQPTTPALAQRPSTSVVVENTPLPVQPGDTTFPVSGNVGVTGTAAVQSDPTEPFRAFESRFIQDGSQRRFADIVTVPAGKRLWIKYVSASSFTEGDAANKFAIIVTKFPSPGLVFEAHFPMTGERHFSGELFKASEQTNILVEEGEEVRCEWSRDTTNGRGLSKCLVVGYMVDA